MCPYIHNVFLRVKFSFVTSQKIREPAEAHKSFFIHSRVNLQRIQGIRLLSLGRATLPVSC